MMKVLWDILRACCVFLFVHSLVICLVLQAARNYGRRRGKGNDFKTYETELHNHFFCDY